MSIADGARLEDRNDLY